MDKINKKNLLEDITKAEISSMIKDKIRSSESERYIKEICSDVISEFLKTVWQKRSFWKNDVKR